MLSVVMLNVIMLSFVMLSVIIPRVMALSMTVGEPKNILEKKITIFVRVGVAP